MTQADVNELQSDLADSQAATEGYKAHIEDLEKEIDALEAVVAKLEAEGLEPLVERMRSQITTIRKLVLAMATAIDELTEQPSAK